MRGATRREVMGGLWGTAILALAGCKGQTASYRFRMTVNVQTPAGLKSGASVYEVSSYKVVRLTSEEKSGGGGLRGEAVIVDLPEGPLFVLLKSNKAGNGLGANATLALLPQTQRGNIDAYVAAVQTLGSGGRYTAELPREDWPIMVRFRNINDPKSIERVDPEAIGVVRIVIETTDDPMTTGIEKRFPPWFERLAASGSRFDGNNSIAVLSNPASVAGQFGPGDFSTVYKVQR